MAVCLEKVGGPHRKQLMTGFIRSGGTKGENVKVRSKQMTCCTIPTSILPTSLVESFKMCRCAEKMTCYPF